MPPRLMRKFWSRLLISLLPVSPMRFRYWDGERIRAIDPRRPAWILEAKFPPAVETEEQLSTAIRVTRHAFQVAAYDPATGRGLTDRESLELVRQFWRYYSRVIDSSAAWLKFVRLLERLNSLIQPRAK